MARSLQSASSSELKIAVDRTRSSAVDRAWLGLPWAEHAFSSFVSKYLVSFPLYMRAKELPR